jgi:hypothetical protein
MHNFLRCLPRIYQLYHLRVLSKGRQRRLTRIGLLTCLLKKRHGGNVKKKRPLLINIVGYREKAEILSKWKLLKGTGVTIGDDPFPEERKTRAMLNSKRKDITQFDKMAKCRIRNGVMSVQSKGNDERYRVNEANWTL